MASFMEDLWNGIFVAGPTPTLLLATNVTFGALQVLLLALFIATYSIHFVILSLLCGGLWYAINWFAHELRVVQQKEAEEKIHNKDKAEGSENVDKGLDMQTQVLETHQPAKSIGEPINNASGLEQGENKNIRRRTLQDPSSSSSSSTNIEMHADSDWEHVDGER